MGADLVSENNPDNDPDSHRDNDPGNHRDSDDTTNLAIPSPRPAPDNHIESLPEISSDDPVWWYDQRGKRGKRGKNRRYWGEVERISGAEGDQLRENLAAVIRDLLDWANQEVKNSKTDSETGSGEEGGTDDTPA